MFESQAAATVIAALISAAAAILISQIQARAAEKRAQEQAREAEERARAQAEENHALMEYKIDQLTRKVDLHNNVIERMYKLEETQARQEEQIKTLFNQGGARNA